MIVKETYTIEEVLDKVIFTDPRVIQNRRDALTDFDGDPIKMNSLRYQVFKTKGVKCVHCGIEGKFFRKEKSDTNVSRYHFNLYAIDSKGKEVLMTKDDIVSKSKGGGNQLENFQVMCVECNYKKGK